MLVEKIEEYLSEPIEYSEWPGYWNATNCTGCPRALIYIARGIKPPGRPGPWDIYKMQDGNLHEDDIKARLRLKGIRIEEPGAIMLSQAPVVCHPDGIVSLDGVPFGLEIKSYGCDYFHPLTIRGVKDYSPRYYRQMQLYMLATGIKQWILLAKDRNCCLIHEEIVAYDDAVAQELIDIILSAKAVLDQNLDAQALPCSSDFMTRQFCSFSPMCEGPSKEVWTMEASKAAEDWLWAQHIKDEAEQHIETARQTFREILSSLNVPAIDVAGSLQGSLQRLRVYASGQKRRIPNMSLAEKLLEPDVFGQIFEVREFPGPRVYRLKGDAQSGADNA